ncbi:uncharacterized protein ACA1_080720 [Acanthamoeba castellanii str. Neff]|uniref:Uncharacterized protein n=1 Tax=Acanthamoeba castellanii (strain ATCC 30010 / Neff) TaxID=1257118 RepID=L8HAZ7_ACACF|nr:uncharacterized protein ACA1_080720 [Acanthamoeba castellanii str. Neff]ELR22674.1 hypothetical protein ACA1_080720 [Acanthamoeba castellanii str. Neff]
MKVVTKGGGKPVLWSKPKVLLKQLLTFLGVDGEDFYVWKDQLLITQVLHGYDDSKFTPIVAYALAGTAMKRMSVQPAATTHIAVALFLLVEYKALCNQLDHYKSNKITQQAAAMPMGLSLAEQLTMLMEAMA